MLSVEEARARVLARMQPVPPEIVGLAQAWNRVTAAPVLARLTQPPADVSAMDGYAVRAGDAQAGATLRQIGAAPAGHPFAGSLGAGETVRIFTGSVIPAGADAVLLQEDAEAAGDQVQVRAAVRAGQHIRSKGQDFTAGQEVLPAGRRLTARDIGLAAAANHPWLAVHRAPRVAILATGDEIALPGEPIPPGGIVSSNAHALAALVRARGGEPSVLAVAGDDAGAIAEAGRQAMGADLLVTTGGVSVGAHDLVQEGLGRAGLALDFWKIAMRPGKPLMLGDMAGLPVLGLPGNPVSALVCAVLFLLPALDVLAGQPAGALPVLRARLATPLPANDRRADHLRATLQQGPEGQLATPFMRQDSALLSAFAAADCLILRPPHAPAAPAGAEVDVIPLAALGI